MKNFLKNTWQAIAGLVLIPAAFAAGVATDGEVKDLPPFDTKGQDVRLQVLVKQPGFQDAVYYTPNQWAEKTEEAINTEKQTRYDNWLQLVAEQSQQVTPEPTKEQLEEQKTQLEQQLQELDQQINAKSK
jgi:hypothetical protein